MAQTAIAISTRMLPKNVVVLDIAGDLTGMAEEPLMAAYAAASDGGARTINLKFDELGYMNSSGIGLLVTLLIRVQRSKQKLLAVGLTDHYQQIFELTRLNEAIASYADEASALATLNGAG